MGRIASTGLETAMSQMDVISNNIANANTCGFKASTTQFEDIYQSSGTSNTTVGLGVNLASINQNFQPGSQVADGIQSHLMITGNNGFFVLKEQNTGATTYSRNGQFTFNLNQGYFMLGNSRLQGFAAVNGSIPQGGTPTDLYINTSPVPAVPTTQIIQKNVNLSSSDATPKNATFNPADTNSYNFATPTQVYDSLGNPNNVTLYYVKSPTANTWQVYAAMGSTVLNASSPGALTFNTDGTLNSATNLSSISFSPTTGAASPQTFSAVMGGVTQNAGPDNTGQYSTNGAGPGVYQGYSIDSNGNVMVSYSNAQSKLVGQVALADFPTPQNLQYLGQGIWNATMSAGTPSVTPGNSTGNITSGAYENSNVEVASELVNLINAQNQFQANAQVEQVYNQIMQTVTEKL
jgi:flagellar hook protein FlgE